MRTDTIKKICKSCLYSAHSVTASALNIFFPPVIVLAYHRVAELDSDPSQLAVSPKHFHQHLEKISAIFNDIFRFDEEWRHTKTPSICLTFDDGYADNFTAALPVLERFSVPATFFVSTSHVETSKWYWWDVLDVCGLGNEHARIIALPPDDQEKAVTALLLHHGLPVKPPSTYRPMSVAELKNCAQHPLVCIGAHTHTHPRLAQLSYEAQREEIRSSLDKLEAWTGRRPKTAAYPFGARSPLGRNCDYNNDSIQACRSLELKRCAANYPDQVRPWTNPYAVPRHLVRNWDGEEFETRLREFLTIGYF